MSNYRRVPHYNRCALITIILFIFVLVSFQAFSQEASSTSEKRVAEEAKKRGVSPEQIKSMGIDPSNPEQAIQKARELGVPESEIQQIINDQQPTGSNIPPVETAPQVIQEEVIQETPPLAPEEIEPEVTEEVTEEEILEEVLEEVIEEEVLEEEIIEEETDIEITSVLTGRFAGLSYYGYGIFQRGKASTGQVRVGPIDPGYTISSGDVLRLILWGEVDFQYELAVNEKGNIIIPKIGPIFVSGTRYEKLQEKIKNLLSKFYSGLVNDPPTIFMDVSLAQLRNNQIYILGEVSNPGTYSLSSYGTSFDALYAVGGPLTTGSLREIRIIREGKVASKIDFYEYLLKGVSSDDERLRYNDIIFIPPREVTVGIKGEILRPAIYELNGKEGLADLIDLAGGLNPSAYSFRAQIDRIKPLDMRVKGIIERELIDIDINEMTKNNKNISLDDGDVITIFPIIDTVQNFVDIYGAGITRQGRYELNETIVTLTDLIEEADGLTSDVYLPKADIIRIKEDLTEEFIEIDLDAALSGDSNNNITLQDQDRIRIYSKNEMIGRSAVTINGYVVTPGTYALPENMTIYDLIFKHAGLQDTLRYKNAYLERGDIYRLSENAKTRYIIKFNLGEVWEQKAESKIILERGDIVTLYSRDEIVGNPQVSINGYVKRGGTYPLSDNMILYDLIFKYAGFQDSLHYKNTYLERADISRLSENTKTRYIVKFNVQEVWEQKAESKIKIERGDIITLYSRDEIVGNPQVSISGFVKRGGTYPLSDNMSLHDLLFKYSGLQDSVHYAHTFLERGDIYRLEDDQKTSFIIPFNVANAWNNKEEENYLLQKGDSVVLYESGIKDYYEKIVNIDGFVKNPGEYAWKADMTLADLIVESGGFTFGAWIRNAEIARFPFMGTSGDSTAVILYPEIYTNAYVDDPEKIIPEILTNNTEAAKFRLKPHDRVFIRPNPKLEDVGTVSIGGAIKMPGTYVIKKHTERISDLIRRAGGLQENAYLGGSQLTRNGLRVFIDFEDIYRTIIPFKKTNKKANVIILSGDSIIIPPQPSVVQILGEVMNPGLYKHMRNKSATDYVQLAGGRTEEGDKIIVQSASGFVKKVGFFSNPKVRDGSIITVFAKPPEEPKEEKEDIDWSSTIKDSFALMSSAMMIIYLSKQIQ